MKIIFGNFGSTTLSGPIGPSDTSMTVSSGTGALFPSPGADEYFVIVLTDHATKAIHEVVWCTARSGDTMTIARAKEGTTALSWVTSDLVQNPPTAGQMAALAQLAQPASFTTLEATTSTDFPTPADGDDSNQGATTEFVNTAIYNAKKLRQHVIQQTTSTGTTSSEILIDGSIPQNTEGVEILTASITPVAADSVIVVVLQGNFGNSGNYTTVALFKDSTANAVGATCVSVANNGGVAPGVLVYSETAGTTSARTFKVRYGSAVSSGSASYNRSHNGNTYGAGKLATTLEIFEYAP